LALIWCNLSLLLQERSNSVNRIEFLLARSLVSFNVWNASLIIDFAFASLSFSTQLLEPRPTSNYDDGEGCDGSWEGMYFHYLLSDDIVRICRIIIIRFPIDICGYYSHSLCAYFILSTSWLLWSLHSYHCLHFLSALYKPLSSFDKSNSKSWHTSC
jgi:hypothetical protein